MNKQEMRELIKLVQENDAKAFNEKWRWGIINILQITTYVF